MDPFDFEPFDLEPFDLEPFLEPADFEPLDLELVDLEPFFEPVDLPLSVVFWSVVVVEVPCAMTVAGRTVDAPTNDISVNAAINAFMKNS
ncbi:MAG TPA: hypothetical protein VMU06_14495 [Stellaceae bacterium]|nr:hypothetical protein [Stellaceae bacterium]